jgi:hypothetical protein
VTFRITKLILLTAMIITTNGCQLLIDNRGGDSGAVVVVPSAEWDALRQASVTASQTETDSEINTVTSLVPPVKIEPTPGSERIRFTNYTGASLGGCATIGIIELHHQGNMDDAITLLKNEAFRLDSNFLVPTQMNNNKTDQPATITIEARMLTCPLKLARGN